ncbi:LOW QUALITY PROTEIN: serine protease inhibitor 42Dd [Drosophila eugracilis]|uniref:LOW QUALITY PROTEIN: serine protease inhibitor 42Dd n=1 Tax=Drosophila eugracilis TaxID=29029 RepID=UPI001BD95430|nr:LOW QUALITY PROTEIN: serine protease inhibitor 42Dd [Drosophila eugracilis]
MKYLFLAFLATSVLGQFTEKLFHNLIQYHKNSNFIVSTLSVEIGMSMILVGAEENTAKELRAALLLPQDKNQVASQFEDLLSYLDKRKKVAMLHIANRLFVNESYEINKDYNELVKKSFRAEAVTINLANQSKAAWTINDWVMDQTLDNLKGVIAPENLAHDETAVLVNAAFFKGYWKTRFRRVHTEPTTFYVSNHHKVSVNMMSQVGRFKMNELPYGQIIELPFAYSNLSMVIVLPKNNSYLGKAESVIERYSEVLPNEVHVRVQLPDFKIEFRTELIGILKKMGIKELFTDSSDLSSLVKPKGTRISRVVHKAYIEINEEGASAGGAFAGAISVAGLIWYSVASFRADRPFVFLIRDKNTVFFRGRLMDPMSIATV